MPRQDDRIARVLHGGGQLHEQHGELGNRRLALRGVLPVVQADAEQVRRRDRGQQLGHDRRLLRDGMLAENVAGNLHGVPSSWSEAYPTRWSES